MEYSSAGRRPYAWWAIERKELPPRTREADVSRLVAIQELSDSEIDELQGSTHLGDGPRSAWEAAQDALSGRFIREDGVEDLSSHEKLWWRGATALP